MHRGSIALLAASATILGMPMAAGAAEPTASAPQAELLSVPDDGGILPGWAGIQGISADGNVTLFLSTDDYTSGGLSAKIKYMLFAHFRDTGGNFLVNAGQDGEPVKYWVGRSDLNADGRYAAFVSEQDDVTPGDHNNAPDVFLRDLEFETTVLVSVGTGSGTAAGWSYAPWVSADGSEVIFASNRRDLVDGVSADHYNVFVRDLATGRTELLSRGYDGQPADDDVSSLGSTADGRYVLMNSAATNLVRSDHDNLGDLFLLDRSTGKYTEITKDAAMYGPNRGAGGVLSADGSTIVLSTETAYQQDDDNGRRDVYRYDVASKTFELLSRSVDGAVLKHDSSDPSVSGDGSLVAYSAIRPEKQVGPGYGNCRKPNVVVRDLEAGTVTLAGLDQAGQCTNKAVQVPKMGVNRYLAFEARAPLVDEDVDGTWDVYGVDLS